MSGVLGGSSGEMSGESHGGENVRGNVRIPSRHTRLERALGFVMRRTRFDTQAGDRRVRTLSKLLTRNCSASEGCKDINKSTPSVIRSSWLTENLRTLDGGQY